MKYEELSAARKSRIEKYIAMLLKYNEKTNLTAFGSREEVLEKGVISSFCGLGFLKGGKFVDIGSGSGIPAIPLAVCGGIGKWVFLEPARLKAYFLRECVSRLEIQAEVIEMTGEEYFSSGVEPADGITLRGVNIRPRLMKLVRNGLNPSAPFLVWTGKESGSRYETELARCGFSVAVRKEEKWGTFLVNVPCGTQSTK